MGDPYIARSFNRAFHPPVANWQYDQKLEDSSGCRLLYTTCPITKLARRPLFDEVCRRLGQASREPPGISELCRLSVASNVSLDKELRLCGLAQNLGKQIALVGLTGRGAIRDRMLVKKGLVPLPGKEADTVNSLGAVLHHMMSSFWHKSGIPWSSEKRSRNFRGCGVQTSAEHRRTNLAVGLVRRFEAPCRTNLTVRLARRCEAPAEQ